MEAGGANGNVSRKQPCTCIRDRCYKHLLALRAFHTGSAAHGSGRAASLASVASEYGNGFAVGGRSMA